MADNIFTTVVEKLAGIMKDAVTGLQSKIEADVAAAEDRVTKSFDKKIADLEARIVGSAPIILSPAVADLTKAVAAIAPGPGRTPKRIDAGGGIMKTSAAGVAKLRSREGCRLTAYRDPVGVLTIGVGHTGRASGPAVTTGMTITMAQADAILAGDLVPFEASVNSAIKLPMTQNQFDACISLAFNIGQHGFTGSTVVHKFNAGDPAGAADAFLMWEKPIELKTRRISERAQFLSVDQPAASPASTTSFAPPHILPKPAKTSAATKAKVGAVTVAAGSAVAAAAAPHGGIAMGVFITLSGICAAVAVAIHWRK